VRAGGTDEPPPLGDPELETLLGLVPDPAVIVDGSGLIVAANESIGQLFGYGPAELVGERIEVLVPERLRQVHRRHRTGFVESPRARQMGQGLDLFGRRRDGSELPIDVSLAPITTGAGLRVMAAIRDISERRAAEADRAQLATIVEFARDAIVSTSIEGSFTSWNRGAEALFGYAAADAVGRHLSLLVPPERSEEFEASLGDAMAGRPSVPLDTRWRRGDGTEIDVAVSVSAVRSAEGKAVAFALLVRDITERKQSEAELHRLLSEEQRRERWQSAMAEIRLMMLSDRGTGDILHALCTSVAETLAGDRVLVLVQGDRGLRTVASTGPGAGDAGEIAASDVLARAVRTGELQVASHDGGVVMSAPFRSERHSGALVVVRAPEASPPDALDERTAAGFSEQAGLVLQLAQAKEDQQRLMLVADRERIARDLHDIVIQRLFAVGMGLQAATRLVRDDQVAARVNSAVDDLDTTIREIRTVIFELEPPPVVGKGLRAEVLELAVRARDSLGFDPVVHFEGPIDAGVPDRVAPHLLAALQEALSNVARHAKASHAEVELTVGGDVVLVVADDGTGIGELSRMSGLANLRQRAEELGGALELGKRDEGGTRLEWRVPR
jgi:PAS domain S-box-containing protein